MTDSDPGPPRVDKHEAADRAGKAALRAAHDLGAALAGDDGVQEPVVLRTRGPHRSIDALAAVIDDALEESPDGAFPDRPGR